jgi:uncharacterized OB-fold protein
VDAGSIDAMSTGMRVAPAGAARIGHITDIEAFVPGEEPVVPATTAARRRPVTMMDYNASTPHAAGHGQRARREANEEGRFIGLQCPVCARTYTGGRGYCPVDSVALGPEHEVELPQRGTITNYTIITPVQYPGQTETEPFARVHVWLDDTDVVLGYQPLLDTANDGRASDGVRRPGRRRPS